MSNLQKRSKIESIKESSNGLRGNIVQELGEPTEIFSKDSVQILKFHGMYQCDDRDLRRERQQAGQGKAFQFMVRIKNPGGGRLTPEQWLAVDEVSELHGDGTIRITTRQGLQFYGIGKDNLKAVIQRLDSQKLTTFGACGDGTRNVMACPASAIRAGSAFDGQEWADKISEKLSYTTTAYYDIWLDGEKITQSEEPLYGDSYLPRKFKIALADPHDNCVEILTNDIGILPAMHEDHLEGFHVMVGGGMGATHRKAETFPRLAEPLTFVEPSQLLDTLVAILATQRDLGNRSNRRRARMKYLVEELGIDGFRQEVESRLGSPLPTTRPFPINHGECHRGWHAQREPGRYYFGLFVENGRIADLPKRRLRTALREAVKRFRPNILLTPNQDLILSDVPAERIHLLYALLEEYGVLDESGTSRLRSRSMACPALPTCGLAITEAERYLPTLIAELEQAGYGAEEVQIRMSGCPNSCSRPPVAEVGLVGKSVNAYTVFVGGSLSSARLARLLSDSVSTEELPNLIARLIDIFRSERRDGESFGDTTHRLGPERLQEMLKSLERTQDQEQPVPATAETAQA
jgi:sulfite reductase beta subunit-like hemoprotein